MNAATKTAPTAPTATAATSTLVFSFCDALSHEGLTKLENAADVQRRLFGLGYKRTCSRCLGSGSYGPLCVQGGVCFGCGGKRELVPGLSAELLRKVQAEVSPATLAAYAARLVEARKAKSEAKKADKRVSDAYATTLFMRTFFSDGRGRNVSSLAVALHDNEIAPREKFYELARALGRGESSAEEVLAAEAAVVRARKIQDLAVAGALASGEIAEDLQVDAERRAARCGKPVDCDLERAERMATCARATELLALAEFALGV